MFNREKRQKEHTRRILTKEGFKNILVNRGKKKEEEERNKAIRNTALVLSGLGLSAVAARQLSKRVVKESSQEVVERLAKSKPTIGTSKATPKKPVPKSVSKPKSVNPNKSSTKTTPKSETSKTRETENSRETSKTRKPDRATTTNKTKKDSESKVTKKKPSTKTTTDTKDNKSVSTKRKSIKRLTAGKEVKETNPLTGAKRLSTKERNEKSIKNKLSKLTPKKKGVKRDSVRKSLKRSNSLKGRTRKDVRKKVSDRLKTRQKQRTELGVKARKGKIERPNKKVRKSIKKTPRSSKAIGAVKQERFDKVIKPTRKKASKGKAALEKKLGRVTTKQRELPTQLNKLEARFQEINESSLSTVEKELQRWKVLEAESPQLAFIEKQKVLLEAIENPVSTKGIRNLSKYNNIDAYLKAQRGAKEGILKEIYGGKELTGSAGKVLSNLGKSKTTGREALVKEVGELIRLKTKPNNTSSLKIAAKEKAVLERIERELKRKTEIAEQILDKVDDNQQVSNPYELLKRLNPNIKTLNRAEKRRLKYTGSAIDPNKTYLERTTIDEIMSEMKKLKDFVKKVHNNKAGVAKTNTLYKRLNQNYERYLARQGVSKTQAKKGAERIVKEIFGQPIEMSTKAADEIINKIDDQLLKYEDRYMKLVITPEQNRLRRLADKKSKTLIEFLLKRNELTPEVTEELTQAALRGTSKGILRRQVKGVMTRSIKKRLGFIGDERINGIMDILDKMDRDTNRVRRFYQSLNDYADDVESQMTGVLKQYGDEANILDYKMNIIDKVGNKKMSRREAIGDIFRSVKRANETNIMEELYTDPKEVTEVIADKMRKIDNSFYIKTRRLFNGATKKGLVERDLFDKIFRPRWNPFNRLKDYDYEMSARIMRRMLDRDRPIWSYIREKSGIKNPWSTLSRMEGLAKKTGSELPNLYK